MTKHFTRIRDLGYDNAWKVLRRAKEMKDSKYRGDLLAGKTATLIFEKASTRTRMSFETAVHQLGGKSFLMTPTESQLGRSEPLKDTARVLSRYSDCLIVRTFGEERLQELIDYSSIPVINALTDQGHPCQVMSDLLTIYERTPDLPNVRVAWIGDGNNMALSWIEAAVFFNFELFMAFPRGYEPSSDALDFAMKLGAKIFLTNDPKMAIDGANYVNTDVFTSMGQESEQKERLEAFKGFCIDEDLMKLAAPNAKFMHCLPVHRGEEVTEDVFEGERSIVWDEAENRLHMQKAIIEWAMTENY